MFIPKKQRKKLEEMEKKAASEAKESGAPARPTQKIISAPGLGIEGQFSSSSCSNFSSEMQSNDQFLPSATSVSDFGLLD